MTRTLKTCLLALLGCLWMGTAGAQEAVIRKNLTSRLPDLPPIDEIRPTPMKGLYEVRVNHSDIFYTDAAGNFILQGNLIDTRARSDLTERRVAQLTAVRFDELPFEDAFTIVRGDGRRRLAVFEDPNCGYCKRLERDLAKVDDVTIHVFLYPILGRDSQEKSRQIWCAKDKGKVFVDWMVRGVAIPASAECDTSALQRNTAMGQRMRITGTPTLFFPDGTRVPGAIDRATIEKLLQAQ